MSEEVKVISASRSGTVATIEINRPQALNALNLDVLEKMRAEIKTLAAECNAAAAGAARVLVIRSAGEKAFVAGADIKLMQSADEAQLRSYTELGQEVMRSLELLPIPVIARVQGWAIGGGFELALACDLIVAADTARFGQAEVKLGLIPGFGGTQRMLARAGMGTAKRLVLTGDDIPAAEAKSLGLVDFVVSAGELDSTIEKLCETLRQRSTPALAAAKRALEKFFGENKPLGLRNELEEFLGCARTAEAREGMAAFLEKRKANFGE